MNKGGHGGGEVGEKRASKGESRGTRKSHEGCKGFFFPSIFCVVFVVLGGLHGGEGNI